MWRHRAARVAFPRRDGSRRRRGLRFAVAAAVAGTLVAVSAGPAQATPVLDESQWIKGSVPFNTKMVCLGLLNCMVYTAVMARVDYQGPIGNIAATPKTGERFYVHVQTSVVFPSAVSDAYQMRVLLPAGVTPSITSVTDVQCAVTDNADNVVRVPGPDECQDPVQAGIFQQFPPVSLESGQTAHFFFPVVASAPLDPNSDVIGLQADPLGNPLGAMPDPLWSTVAIGVTAAPLPPVTPPTTPTTPTPPVPGTPTPGAATRVVTKAVGWPARPILARAGRSATKSVTVPVTVTPARGRVGVLQKQACRKVGTRTVCTWAKVRSLVWPRTATGRVLVVLTAPRGRTVTYRLVLPQTASAKALVTRALVVRGV